MSSPSSPGSCTGWACCTRQILDACQLIGHQIVVMARLHHIRGRTRPAGAGIGCFGAREAPAGRGDEFCPGPIAEPEGIGQSGEGVLVREPGTATFEITDGPDAQPGPFGQFLLGQPGRLAARSQPGPERLGNIAHARPHEQGRARRIVAGYLIAGDGKSPAV